MSFLKGTEELLPNLKISAADKSKLLEPGLSQLNR